LITPENGEMEVVMSIIIYSVFDSTDAAELASIRLKRAVKDIKVAGISRRVMPDESEEMTIYAYPALYMGSDGVGPYGSFAPIIMSDGTSGDSRNEYEPAGREDVKMRVEARDVKTAQKAEMVLRSNGAHEIRHITT
jgi:hypothetical protein